MMKEEEISLFLLDINLGERFGFELCKKLRRESSIPILFISARTSDDDVLTALNIGGDDYIKKPFSLNILLARLERGDLDEEEAKDKLFRIYGKLGQIDTMISDMFQSTLQELGEMKVTCQEVSSACLLEILDHADYEKKLTAKKLPECLLFIDEFRMA